MSGPSELYAITAAFTTTLRIAEKFYEITAVQQEAKDLLEITSQTTVKLAQAKGLRRQKSDLLSRLEKSLIADAFRAAEKAIETVSKLVEPARADLAVSGGPDVGRVGLKTRLQFVFRDSNKIPVSLQKLNIASSDLNMAISMLNAKDAVRHPQPDGTTRADYKPPPTYQESEFLHHSRQRNMQRRESMAFLRSNRMPVESPNSSIATPSEDAVELAYDGEFSTRSISLPTEAVETIFELPNNSDISATPGSASVEVEERAMSKASPQLTKAYERFLDPTYTEMPIIEEPIGGPLKGKARSRAWMERRMELG